MGIKIVLHEQNILPGITNRILSYLANRIYVSFKDTQANFNSRKVCVTGNPVRNEILCFAMEESEISDSVPGKFFTIFVIGGSQGAHSINMAVVDALKFLKEKDAFFFIHQTGDVDEEEVKNAYREDGITGTVKSFFNDMGQQYRNADLVICRAGATTVAELTAIGKGALLIPYPFAADDHQVLNAKILSGAGAAEIILQKEVSGKSLAKKIEYYASNYKVLSNMALMAKKLGRPDAAKAIVDDCYKLMVPDYVS